MYKLDKSVYFNGLVFVNVYKLNKNSTKYWQSVFHYIYWAYDKIFIVQYDSINNFCFSVFQTNGIQSILTALLQYLCTIVFTHLIYTIQWMLVYL